jgi:type II secretion system (T2SS) protein M
MTSRDRRTLIVGMALIACLFAGAKGLPAVVTWQRDQTLASLRAGQLLAAALIDPADLRAARDSLAARRARFDAFDAALPVATSSSEAVARLASALEDLADSCAVRVSSIQLRSDSVTSNGLTEVSARLNGVADVAGLASLLHAIAVSEHPLVVRELSVTSSDPAAPSTKAEALRFDVLVAGLARSGGQPKS